MYNRQRRKFILYGIVRMKRYMWNRESPISHKQSLESKVLYRTIPISRNVRQWLYVVPIVL